MNYIQLSDKGASLYKATYQTMLDRVSENGFAQTSLTGAYPGMFVRDASIQVMAHIAEGDYEYAKRILQYMVAYHRALKAEYAVHVMNGLVEEEYHDINGEILPGTAIGGEVEAIWTLPKEQNDQYIISAEISLCAQGDATEHDTVTASLYKGGMLVDEITHKVSSINEDGERFAFCLPIEECESTEAFAIRLRASRKGSVICVDNTIRVGVQKHIGAYSWGIQPDGHYMWVNAFAMFALNCPEEQVEFVHKTYPFMVKFSKYFIQNSEYMHTNGLIRNPMYEHTRKGRYWESYDLITNTFASEALHKMSQLASRMGDNKNKKFFEYAADSLAASIHQHLVCEMDGLKFYMEMVALDEGSRVIPGFSFVSLAPIACEWYAVDESLLANTYVQYCKYGAELYHGTYEMLVACCELEEGHWNESHYDHVIGKGLAWELYYLWKTGQSVRLQKMLDFIEVYSNNVYPEVWKRTGTICDSANQEQASWILYEIARITGRWKELDISNLRQPQ